MNRSETSSRAVAYLRRSTDKQEKSLVDQLSWAKRSAESRGRAVLLTVPDDIEARLKTRGMFQAGDVYFDDAISGAVEQRPGFQAMLKRIREDKSVAYLFVWERTRLGRFERNETGMTFEKDISEDGVTIVLKDGEIKPRLISDGPQYNELAANADWISGGRMRVDLAENTLRGLRDSAEGGLWCGGNPPFGFVRAVFRLADRTVGEVLQSNRGIRGVNGEAVVIIPGPDQENVDRLKVVRYIAEEYARGIVGLHGIAKELNRRAIPSPYAGRKRLQADKSVREVWGKWTVNSVRGVLENPVYAGKLAYGRREYGSLRRFDKDSDTGYRKVTNEERKPNKRKARAKEHRDPEDWLLVDPAAPFIPIIPYALYEANLARLKQMAVVGNQRGKTKCADPNKYPVAVYCADCGQRMAGHMHGKNANWMCSRFINTNRTECFNNWVLRDEVVIFAVEQIRRKIHLLANRQRLEAEIRKVLDEHRSSQSEVEGKILMAKAKVEVLRTQAKRAYIDHNNARSDHERQMTREVYDQRHEELTQVEGVLRSLESSLAMHGIGNEDSITQSLSYLENFERLLPNLPQDQLRRTFDALGVRLEVRFAPNTDPKSRRQRVPVGGTMTFGARGLGQGVSGNDSPPAGAEGASSKTMKLGLVAGAGFEPATSGL